jgi:hypothetical protein
MQDHLQYTFTGKIKTMSFILMAIGVVTIGINFATHYEQTWANIMHDNFYFMAIALGGMFFYSIQYAAEVGWSVSVIRIMQAMSQYLWIPGVIMILIFVFDRHEIWHWTNPNSYVEKLANGQPNPEFDEILAGKQGFLNMGFYTIRMVGYFVIWYGFARFLRKQALLGDQTGGVEYYERSRKWAITFLVLFAVTVSTSSWDFVMSIDAHWFSTMFGWYTFAGIFISSLSTLALILVYLRKSGYMQHINPNHLQDVGKFMFAFSIFWTYLWFAQYMLIWYANLPEEVVYFNERFNNYRAIFWINFFVNFIMPFLLLMTRDAKRRLNVLLVAGCIIFIGHWIDTYVMIIPGVMHDHAHLGWHEIGNACGFLGLFIFVVFSSLEKASLLPKHHPMLEESLHHVC